MSLVHPDRLFPSTSPARDIARNLYEKVKKLPIISPHGHTDPRWFAQNLAFSDPAQLLVIPDHYVFRMLVSQGMTLHDLGIARADGGAVQSDGRAIWHLFAQNYHLFRATPSRLWLDHTFETVFGLDQRLCAANADLYYDHIAQALQTPAFLPRALFERFNIEVIATTDSALDDLQWHKMIRASGWAGRVVPTYRPDTVVDPEQPDFAENLARLGQITNEDTQTWQGYLAAHRKRRLFFKSMGATATDHGHATARTENLSQLDAAALFSTIRLGAATAEAADTFRGQMLTEMARLSLEDGLVMQLHADSYRNHSAPVMTDYGRDRGFDIPMRTDFVRALRPLLNAFGMDTRLTVIVFTLDETAYSRELAPLAGAYPALKLGPAWWFHDSPQGMQRYREMTTETAGFYNTVGFNDDTRAFLSIPARHDMARRADCAFLAELVATGRMDLDEAEDVAVALSYRLAKSSYKL